MKKFILIIFALTSYANASGQSHDISTTAKDFLNLLSADVKTQAQFKFEDVERFDWHYVPRGRNGVSLHDLTQPQLDAAINLLKASLSVQGFRKATHVMGLE